MHNEVSKRRAWVVVKKMWIDHGTYGSGKAKVWKIFDVSTLGLFQQYPSRGKIFHTKNIKAT
jgi:hypothetical protein